MDPLSEVLSVLKPRDVIARAFDMGGEWAVQFGPHEGIKCYAVHSGGCWLVVEGLAEPVRLETGDCFLLPRGFPFRLASGLDVPVTDWREVFHCPKMDGGVVVWQGGGACFGVGGHFLLAGPAARMLLNELPVVVHVRAEQAREQWWWCLQRMGEEFRADRPGGSLVLQQLATMMLVQALRLHAVCGTGASGWLGALADAQMQVAIRAVHEEPGADWTVERLAERCGMSRSVFAERFRTVVGSGPMEYVTRWRMVVAGERLRGGESVGEVSRALGYGAESAFGKAFRRVMRVSPREWKRQG